MIVKKNTFMECVTKKFPENLACLTLDRSGYLAELALSGHPQLAADVILNREVCGRLYDVIGNAVHRLNFEFVKNPIVRERVYEALIEIAFNLIGVESRVVGFSEEEVRTASQKIIRALKGWESIERSEKGTPSAARDVIQKLLQDMKKVMMGRSMVTKMAEEIEKEIKEDNLMESFILAAKKALKENVYYQIVTQNLSKFGNDSATGLRRVRHLGAVQVSSNPVVAARAYEEFPNLWDEFKEVVKEHPEWFDAPEKFGDEIVMYGTIISLLPNLFVFRPLFLLSDFHDGLVSYQLNPYVATSLEDTLNDAMKIYSILQEILERYDRYLMWNKSFEGKGRPNMVFKIAGCAPSAIDMTVAFNKMGIGTNNTVTYTVAQEVSLILAEMEGMAEALKMGIHVTQVYETNMEGRLEDHLRETIAEKLLREGLQRVEEKEKEKYLRKLAEEIGALEEIEKVDSLEEKISIVCARNYLKYFPPKVFLKTLTDTRFVNAIKELYEKSENVEALLSQLEEAIHYTGVFVTRRVYNIFFSPENRPKWILYVQKDLGVSREEAEEIMDKIDLLPASKRRAEDTYLVLGERTLTNLTNTEFPSQQLDVWHKSREENFKLSDFKGSIMKEPDTSTLKRLQGLEDFRKAYELTPELMRKLERVGIEGDFGQAGIKPEEWTVFGPVVKTLTEFKGAYLNFKQIAIEFVREVAQEHK